LVFGDGTAGGVLDTAQLQERILRIAGAGPSPEANNESTGSEIWMDDVTGDGLGDLLIARQNHSPDASRYGAGALTILVGGPALRSYAATLQYLDLAQDPPPGVLMSTLIGAATADRLGMWLRTGDVTGDGIADIVVGADQEDGGGENDSGAAYVIRGGPHLAVSQHVDQPFDLADFGVTTLPGNLARITPPVGSTEFHFGATCQIGDLDGNGIGEVLVAAALNRVGGILKASGAPAGSAHGIGGSPDGTVYIAWDDNFTGAWPNGYSFDISSPPVGSRTIIQGSVLNREFGEEMLAGLDYDDDGAADLFVGDIVGDWTASQDRPNSGTGHVLYSASTLKGLVFGLDTPPPGLVTTTILGSAIGDIAADTAAHGDFDDDGIADLMVSSPNADPQGRIGAGALHVFFGQSGPWPPLVDLASPPPPASVRLTEVHGANGGAGSDTGDMLCYSAAAGDVDGDGRVDLVGNEMSGNGLAPGTEDVGNLIILSGALLAGVPACGDSLDNDRDGLTDSGPGGDPGCADGNDLSEKDPALPCDDGADNEPVPDGRVDYRTDLSGDPGCYNPTGPTENPACDDGLDNDSDGQIDWNGGPGGEPADTVCNGQGWRGREAPRRCGLGFELALLLVPLMGIHARRRRALG
jgi:hypothetical protein